MTDGHVEYVGFTVGDTSREYALRVRQPDGESHAFTLSISNKAFLANRVRYQDAPAICFSKLQRELVACGENLPALYMEVTDADLEEYRVAHTPKTKQRSPKTPAAT